MKNKRLSETRQEIIFITKEVVIKWNSRSMAHYINLGYRYTRMHDEFICQTEHLSNGSNVNVVVKCPICSKQRSAVYGTIVRMGHSLCISCSQINDISGMVFGRLTVENLDRNHNTGGNAHWICRCKCGETKSVNANSLVRGITTSCGCYLREINSGENCNFWTGGLTDTICDYCGNSYKVHSQDKTKFCSTKCRGKWQSENLVGEKALRWKGGPVSIRCAWCGEKYKRNKSQLSNHNFCSRECYYKWMSENMVGEAHPNWNPEITDQERYIKRNYLEIKQWAQDILKRDNYTCQICGSKNDLEAHHLLSYAYYPESSLDIDNGITMCKDDHVEFHSWMGGTQVPCTPADLDRWLYETDLAVGENIAH